MTHADRTAAALDLAQEVSDLTGTLYVAVIDYSGAETLPTFAVVDERGGFIVEDLVEEDLLADAVEYLDLADAVAADPATHPPDTRAAFGVETDEEREARDREDEAAWLAEIEAEAANDLALAREREAWSEYAVARDEALYGPSEPVW